MIFRMTASRFLPLLLSFYYFFYFYKYPQPVPVCLVAVFASGASITKKKRACLFAKGHSFQNTIDSHTHLSQSGSVCYDMTKQRHGGESRCVCVARRASGILTQLSQKPPQQPREAAASTRGGLSKRKCAQAQIPSASLGSGIWKMK